MRKLTIAILFLFLSVLSNAQNVGIGADVMYNFQTRGFGAGARVNIFPNRKLSFVPQFSYYPGFNKVKEYYLGLGLEYKVLKVKQFNFYALAHGAYNSWLNYQNSEMDGAKQNNWNLEAGAGVTTNQCLRPFLEYRYNFKFYETHLRLGILYIFGCSKGGIKGKNNGGGRHKVCPAYG